MYTNYTSKVTCKELATVSANLYKRITGEEIASNDLAELSEPQRNATRLEMVEVVYNVIKKAQPDFDFQSDIKLKFEDVNGLSEDLLSIIKYSVSRGILNGRNDKILDLSTACMCFVNRKCNKMTSKMQHPVDPINRRLWNL